LSELQYYISVDRDKSGNANGVWFNVRGKHPDLSQIGIPHAPIRADESNCIINFYLEHVDPKKGKVYAVDAKIDGDLLLGEDYEFINEASLSSREAQVELHKIEFGGYPTVFLTFSAWGEDTKNKQRLGPIGRIRQMHILALGRKLVIPKGSDVMESDSLDIDINEELPDTHIPLQMDRGEMDIVVSKKGDVLGVLATGIRKRLNPADRDRPIVGEREKVEYQIPLDQIKADKIMGKIERAVSNFELACKNKGLPTLPTSTAKESK
jgi:hypothetical protein